MIEGPGPMSFSIFYKEYLKLEINYFFAPENEKEIAKCK